MLTSVTEPESRFFESARLRIHYVAWGDDSKPPLVLVHGGRDHARSWDFVAAHLLDRFAVYAIDLRGHGDSEWSKGHAYQLSHHVADLAKLVNTVGRGRRVDVIGHSLGGRIMIDYACAFPERVGKLVSIEGFGRMPVQLPPAQRLRAFVDEMRASEQHRQRVYPDLASAEERMYEANRRLSPEMVRHLTQHAVRPVEGGYVWKFDYYHRVQATPEWNLDSFKAMWASLKAPILLIGGSDSWFAGHRAEFVEEVLGQRHVMVENAGHWVHHDQLEMFVKLVREFLTRDSL
jgi:pimeloyl-ACP methyl ester carboxylesterase